jgi:3-oxoadipate enol-lactonase
MEAKVNGVRLAYQANGEVSGPALLLVHGFPLDSGMWEAQLEGLADGAYIIAPDLSGHGRSDVPPGPYSMDQHADDLAALLDYLGIPKAIVAGLSMGGYVTMAFWRRHPERVAALALLDTRASADTPEAGAGRSATIERVRERGVVVLEEEMMPRLLSTENQANEELAGRVREIVLRQPAEGMMNALAAMRDREDSTATLATMNVPTIVVGGERDVITPPEVIVTMAKEIPDGRAVLIVNAGHMSPMENPGEVNMALRELVSIARF